MSSSWLQRLVPQRFGMTLHNGSCQWRVQRRSTCVWKPSPWGGAGRFIFVIKISVVVYADNFVAIGATKTQRWPLMSLPTCVRPDIYYYMIANVEWMYWKFSVSFSIVLIGFYAIIPIGFGGCIYEDVLFVVAGVVV
eukprot:3814832-Amphidinium_carterae.1